MLYFTIVTMNILILLIVSITLLGCNHNANDGFKLDGVWVSNCYVAKIASDTETYGITTFTFTDVYVAVDLNFYSDSGCSKNVDKPFVKTLSYVVGGSVTTSEGVDATKIDFTSTSSDGQVELSRNIYSLIDGKLYFGDPNSVDSSNYPTKLRYEVFATKK